MTNEQLAIFAQDSPELVPVLWERVKHLCFQICGQYYSRYTERFAACGVELSDLRQESYGAFLYAVKSFKADSGAKFSTYLTFPIRNAVTQLLGTNTSDKLNHKPLDNAVSLDAPVETADGTISMADILPDHESTEPFENILDCIVDDHARQILSDALITLDDIPCRVILLRYFEDKPLTFAAIGEHLGYTGSRIQQIHSKALEHLRNIPEIVMLWKELQLEQSFHTCSRKNEFKYFQTQKRISEILRNGGEYLSYGEKKAIIEDCKVRRAAQNDPEYQLYMVLAGKDGFKE